MKDILKKIGIWLFLGPALSRSLSIDSILKVALVNLTTILGTTYIIVFFTFLLHGIVSTSDVAIAYVSAFIFIVAFAIIHSNKGIRYFKIVQIVVVFDLVLLCGFLYIDKIIHGKIWGFLIPVFVIFLTNLFRGLILSLCYFVYALYIELYVEAEFLITDWKLYCYIFAYWSLVILASAYETLRMGYHKKLIEEKEKMEILSITDHLTNLYNRRYFSDIIEKEFARTIRQKECLSFLMIDADKFKDYNDTYGHLNGDELLISLAEIFKRVVKRSEDLVFRMGGEEFGVLLPNADSKGASSIAEKMREEVQNNTKITISIGLACVYPKVGENPEALLKLADSNLYKAKETGRNKVVG